MTRWQVFALGIAALAITGFSTRIEGPDVTGIYDFVKGSSQKNPIPVLIIHGMGKYADHPIGWSFTFQQRLGAKLGGLTLKKKSAVKDCSDLDLMNDQDNPPAYDPYAHLKVCTWSNQAGQTVQFYELTWAMLTEPVKDRVLAYDDRDYGKDRESENRKLKRDLIDSSLSDPMLYVGKYTATLRYPIKQTICAMLYGLPAENQRCVMKEETPSVKDVFIVTKSLGSAMLYDTLLEMQKPKQSQRPTASLYRAAQTFKDRTRMIYMFANQLPLLCLTRYAKKDTVCEEKKEVTIKETFTTKIVAISDPNDLLSYPLKSWQLTLIGLAGDPTNVFVDLVPWWYPGLLIGLADPYAAHTGHDTNDDVIAIVACGTSGKSIKKCKD